MRNPISISLEDEIILKIDNARGKNEPRSRFIEDVISQFLDKKDAVVKKDQSNTIQPSRRNVSK